MTRSRSGFTLIELLIVVVIIGILAAIAIPKFGNTKSSAQIAGLKADLRNLSTVQETYFSQFNLYGTASASLISTYFQPSSGVNISIDAYNVSGWAATATATGVNQSCTLAYGGTGAANSTDGIIQCAVIP
jgi:prepilin-type N-terminal cleavage/methylation domain-containing protein